MGDLVFLGFIFVLVPATGDETAPSLHLAESMSFEVKDANACRNATLAINVLLAGTNATLRSACVPKAVGKPEPSPSKQPTREAQL